MSLTSEFYYTIIRVYVCPFVQYLLALTFDRFHIRSRRVILCIAQLNYLEQDAQVGEQSNGVNSPMVRIVNWCPYSGGKLDGRHRHRNTYTHYTPKTTPLAIIGDAILPQVILFVGDLWRIFPILRFPRPLELTTTIYVNITESVVYS